MESIVNIQLAQIKSRLKANNNVELTVDPKVVTELAQEGFDPVFGARPLKRLIQKKMIDVLALAILEGKVKGGDRVKADLKGKEVVFE